MFLQQTKESVSVHVLGIEIYFSFDVKSIQPDPLRTIVVTKTMGRFDLSAIITVIIVGHVKGLMDLSQSSDTDRFGENKLFLNIGKISPCMVRINNLRS